MAVTELIQKSLLVKKIWLLAGAVLCWDHFAYKHFSLNSNILVADMIC